jgi:tetratricopeptide (TPR) repeat protein
MVAALYPAIISAEPPWPGSVTEAVLEAFCGLDGVRSVLLGPLKSAEVLDWLNAEPARDVTTDQGDLGVQRLLEATKGQPLHLSLLLRNLERHRIVDRAGQNSADPVLPEMASILGLMLSQLSPEALAVARAASVAGQDFHAAPTCAFTGLTLQQLSSAIQELQNTGLWHAGDFVHHQVRKAARLATPAGMAKALHARCATWLESQPLAAPARIAAHWLAAGQDIRALPSLQAAARHAQRLQCTPERSASQMRAATIAEQHQQLDLAFNCYCEAFEAHTESIRHSEGERLLAHMQRLARTRAQRARVATQSSWHAMVLGQLDVAIQRGEEALAWAQAEGDEHLLAPARQHLGTALSVAGRLERALPLLQQALPWARQHLPADELASVLGNLAAVLDHMGRSAQARENHLGGLALAAKLADDSHRTTLITNYAMSRLEAGDALGARELGQKAQQLVDGQDAQSPSAGFIAALMAACERSLGRYSVALDWCDRAEHVLAVRNPSRIAVAQLQRAQVWMDLGQHGRALELLSGNKPTGGREWPAQHAVRWLLLLARAQARQGMDPHVSLDEAQSRLPHEGWPHLALLVRAERASLGTGHCAMAELRQVALEAGQRQLDAVALRAWLQCAQFAEFEAKGGRNSNLLAKEAAEAALAAMANGIEAPYLERALRWLAPARALVVAGQDTHAQTLLAQGRQWLLTTAEEQVPKWARDSFLEQHPLNRLLREEPLAVA